MTMAPPTSTPVPCPRLFEAEAIRDGRLAGAELANYARHATMCSACRHEARALDALGEALRSNSQEHVQADELLRLRERTRLVAAFDATLVAPRRRTAALRRTLWPAATAAMIVAAVLFYRARPVRDDSGALHGVSIHSSAAAVWSKHSHGNRARVVLDSGELWIHVDHTLQKISLVVALPDGELEDTGTTFTVSAANGRTTRVAVREGRVVLRIRGQPPLAIAGGGAWAWTDAPPPATAPATVPEASPLASSAFKRTPPSAPSDDKPRERVHSPPAAAPTRRASIRGSLLPPPLLAEMPDPSSEFRAAVAALDVGANREAAATLARFLARHPRDPRAEDAAYLRVIALQRGGSAEETSRAAQDYLRLFPAGFRRAEIEKLSH